LLKDSNPPRLNWNTESAQEPHISWATVSASAQIEQILFRRRWVMAVLLRIDSPWATLHRYLKVDFFSQQYVMKLVSVDLNSTALPGQAQYGFWSGADCGQAGLPLIKLSDGVHTERHQ